MVSSGQQPNVPYIIAVPAEVQYRRRLSRPKIHVQAPAPTTAPIHNAARDAFVQRSDSNHSLRRIFAREISYRKYQLRASLYLTAPDPTVITQMLQTIDNHPTVITLHTRLLRSKFLRFSDKILEEYQRAAPAVPEQVYGLYNGTSWDMPDRAGQRGNQPLIITLPNTNLLTVQAVEQVLGWGRQFTNGAPPRWNRKKRLLRKLIENPLNAPTNASFQNLLELMQAAVELQVRIWQALDPLIMRILGHCERQFISDTDFAMIKSGFIFWGFPWQMAAYAQVMRTLGITAARKDRQQTITKYLRGPRPIQIAQLRVLLRFLGDEPGDPIFVAGKENVVRVIKNAATHQETIQNIWATIRASGRISFAESVQQEIRDMQVERRRQYENINRTADIVFGNITTMPGNWPETDA